MNCRVLLTMGILWLQVLAAPAMSQESSFAELRKAELLLLTAVVDHYECKDAAPRDAVAQLIQQAVSADIPLLVDWSRFKDRAGDDAFKITLNLKKVPAHQVLTYIAELSCSCWCMEGWSQAGMLRFKSLTEDNDEERMSLSQVVELSAEAAAILGLKPGATPEDLQRLFSALGVEAGEGSLFQWNAKDRLLGFRLNRREIPFMQAIARLANSGRQVVKVSVK